MNIENLLNALGLLQPDIQRLVIKVVSFLIIMIIILIFTIIILGIIYPVIGLSIVTLSGLIYSRIKSHK